jgi:hypothetical protein
MVIFDTIFPHILDLRDAYPPLSPASAKKTKAPRGYTYYAPTTNSPTEETRAHAVSPLTTANRTNRQYFEASLSPQPLFLTGFAEVKPDQVAFGKVETLIELVNVVAES